MHPESLESIKTKVHIPHLVQFRKCSILQWTNQSDDNGKVVFA
jgi:hypothetical protein